jgi:hypothetical protein
MSRHRTFAAAFLVTVAVIVPAAWHGLDATIDKDGKHVRPLQQEIEIDGARVTLDVDHNLVHSGDNVIAKLRAFSDTPKRVAVDLTVMRSNDTFGSRVASPPQAIDKEHFTLDAAPDGGKTVDTRLTMEPTGEGNKVDYFRIYVTPKGEKPDVFGGGDDGEGKTSGAVGVVGWTSDDFAISIKSKGKITNGKPFEVAVRIENTSGHALPHAPHIELGTTVALYGIAESDDFKIEGTDDDTGDDYDNKFEAGATRVKKFKVTPQGGTAKDVTFIASAYVWAEEPGPVSEGAMEARTFKIAPAPNDDAAPAVAKE